MDNLISALQKSIAESRSESDVAHALYAFQKEIHPFSCSEIGRRQVKEVFRNLWETLISTMNRFSTLVSIRVATFSVVSTFLIRMTPFFPFQVRESFSEIVSNLATLNKNDPLSSESNDPVPLKSSKQNDKKNIKSSRFIDLYPISNISDATQESSSLSSISILLASSFSFISNFISLELIEDFLVKSPIFHNFIDRGSLESERLPDIISNICDNVGVDWYQSLLLALLQVNSAKAHTWSRSTIKTILAVIRHSPHILMNDVLKFFLDNNNISINQKNYQKDLKDFRIDNSDIALIGFLMTNLEGEMGNIDLLPFAEIALNIIKNSSYSLDQEKVNSNTNKTQIDNAFQILSVNSKYFRLKITQIDDESIKITLIKGRTKFEKKSKFRKKRKKKLHFFSDEEIEKILSKYDNKYPESPYKEVSDSEDFGYINGEYCSTEYFDTEMVQNQNIRLNNSLSSSSMQNLHSDSSISILSTGYQNTANSIVIANAKKLTDRSKSSSSRSDSKDAESSTANDNDDQTENELFRSHEPIRRDIHKKVEVTNSDQNDDNEVVDEVRLKFKPLLENSSFYLLPLPINPFLVPKEDKNEESFPIFSAKLNALASFFTDPNMIIYDDDDKNLENNNVTKSTLDQVISIFEHFMIEKYDIHVSAVLQALQKCVNCILMNAKDPKFIGMLRKVIFAPITSWFHALDILRVISAISPELIEYSFGQRSFTSSGLKEIIELVLNFSMIEKYDKLIEPCFNTIFGMATKYNYYKIINILLNHIDLFTPISIQRHLNIVYELILKFEKDDPCLRYIIQPHCYQYFELLSFYYGDLNTIASLFHILSLYDSTELFYSFPLNQSRSQSSLLQASEQSQSQDQSASQSQSQSQDQSSESESVQELSSVSYNTPFHVHEKLNHFNKAIDLAKLIASAGMTYLIGMKKTEDIAYFYDQIEKNFNSQSIEITGKGVTDYKKQFSCIHAAMCFIFSLPSSISNIENQFVFDMARRFFRFFPREVSTFLLNTKETPEISTQKHIVIRNSMLRNIVPRMEAVKDVDIHSLWCKLLVKFRKSAKTLHKTIKKTIDSVVFYLRNELLKLTVDEILSFINFLYVFDKTSCRFILRTIASIDKVKQIQLLSIASPPIKDIFSEFFKDELTESFIDENETTEDEILLSNVFNRESFEKIIKRIEKHPHLLDFYKENLNGWILLILLRRYKERSEKSNQIMLSSESLLTRESSTASEETKESSAATNESKETKTPENEESKESAVENEEAKEPTVTNEETKEPTVVNKEPKIEELNELLKRDDEEIKIEWRPLNPYFNKYNKNREEQIQLKLQSGVDDAIFLFLYLNRVKSAEMKGLKISSKALVSVIKYLVLKEPNCDLLQETIMKSLTIDDCFGSKRQALFEMMKVKASDFLLDFQVHPHLKKTQLRFLSSFLSQQAPQNFGQQITSTQIKSFIKNDDCVLLFPFMLRLFESAKSVNRVKYVLVLISVLITASPTIPSFFQKGISEYVFNDLKFSISNNNIDTLKQKILTLPDQVGLVFTTLARHQLIKSGSLCSTIYNIKQNSSIELDDITKHNLFLFHISTQNIFSPTFAEMFFLVYSLDGNGMDDSAISDLSTSSFSFEFENELKRTVSSFDSIPSIPSLLFKKTRLLRILLFCKVPMFISSARSFIKHNYQDVYNRSKELKNPFVIENIFKISLDFFLDASYSSNQMFSSAISKNSLSNFIRDYILQNFFQQFIQSSSSISFSVPHSNSNSSLSSSILPGSPFLNTLLRFLLSICSSNNNTEIISFAFSISDMVPMQLTTFKEFLTYIEILKVYLTRVQNPEDKKIIVLNSIKTWTKTLMIIENKSDNDSKEKVVNNDFYCYETYDTYKFIVQYIYLLTQIKVDTNSIIQVIYENFEERFEFFPFFLAILFYVKSLRKSIDNSENNETLFEEGEIGKAMLETFSKGRNVQKRKENVEALEMLIKGKYKEAYNSLIK